MPLLLSAPLIKAGIAFTLLSASFGTTKYCNYFLRSLPCNNPECLYLHELGEEEDSFTKEEMQAGAVRRKNIRSKITFFMG